MDEEDGYFMEEPEEEEFREVVKIDDANPIYSKPISEEPKNISLKMIEIPKPDITSSYQPFKIAFQKNDSDEEDENLQFRFNSPFAEFYSPQQLVYQKFNNSSCNRIKDATYFSGAFIQKNLFADFTKYSEECTSLPQILNEYYDLEEVRLPEPEPNDLVFDSNFQSGNLFAAFKVSGREYDLVMQNDANSYGNNQWFYFSVEKMAAGAEYTFNVVNFTKNDSLFNYGMGPAIYSTLANKKYGSEWSRGGKDVCYKKGVLPRENSRRYYYKLSFKLTSRFNNDKIYFAHSYPYTYERLCNRMDDILARYGDSVTKVQVGKTISKKKIEALVITQRINKKKDTRKAIIIMARQHPGETQGSFVCDGVIDRFLQKGSKQGEFIRKNYIIYVIPMVNPDGVIFGHYRTNLSGKDLNRKWDCTEKEQTVPEVTSIKSFIADISKQRQIRFILDLHGHSKKLNSFFYGNPCPQNPQLVRIFPFLCSKMNPAVQYMDCTFACEEYKRKAARVYLSFYYKQIHVYTFESSFYAYFKEGKKVQFTPKQYENLGGTLVQALHAVLEHEIKNGGNGANISPDPKGKQVSIYSKYLNELKSNKALLEVGTNMESGSESRPEEGEVNSSEIPELVISPKKKVCTPALTEQSGRKEPKRTYSRKGHRQHKQIRQFTKPVRNVRFLQISRVNSVLPDRYQLGLQPIRKKQPQQVISRNGSQQVLRINSSCQTEPKELPWDLTDDKDIQQIKNLSNSIRLNQSNTCSERKYSSVMKNTYRNNNIIFKIDLINQKSASSLGVKERKIFFNAYSQTAISIPVPRPADSPTKSEKNRSSQLFPQVDSPEVDRRLIRTNPLNKKVGMKIEAQVFLNGMVKKYLVDKQVRVKGLGRDEVLKKMERPLSIKKKEIYRK